MPFDSTGRYVRTDNWKRDKDADIKIITEHHDRQDDDFAAALSNCVTRDGRGRFQVNINFNNHRGINAAPGQMLSDVATMQQIVEGANFYVDQSSVANKIRITTDPQITELKNGQHFFIKVNFANTGGNVTLQVNQIQFNQSVEIPVVGRDGKPLPMDNISADSVREFVYYNGEWRMLQSIPGNTLPLLSWFYADAKFDPDIVGYLGFKEQGSVCDGVLYSDAYNKLVNELATSTQASETIRNVTYIFYMNPVTFRRFYTQQVYDAMVTNIGGCIGYIVNTDAKTFTLPKNSHFVRACSDTAKVSDYGDDQIVNITGNTMRVNSYVSRQDSVSGAFSSVQNGTIPVGSGGSDAAFHNNFSAARVVRTGDQVQPRYFNQFVYYVVGNTIIQEGKIDFTTIENEVAASAAAAAQSAVSAANSFAGAQSAEANAQAAAVTAAQKATDAANFSQDAAQSATDAETSAKSIRGLGGYITAFDFGDPTNVTDSQPWWQFSNPTQGGTWQQALTNYALQDIDIQNPADIFNGTRCPNEWDGHLWVLANTPATEPPVFWWTDVGLNTFDPSIFVQTSSMQTQVINADIAIGQNKTLYGTDASGNKFILSNFATGKLNVGDTAESLNLKTADIVTCDTPAGSKMLPFAAEYVSPGSLQTVTAIVPNSVYEYGNVDALDFSQTTAKSTLESRIYFVPTQTFVDNFVAGLLSGSLTLPSNFKANNLPPNYKLGVEYCIAYLDGRWTFGAGAV